MNPILAKAREHFSKKLPFVMYCKPNADKVIGLFQKTCELFPLSIESSGFAFVSFDHKLRYMIPELESDIYFQKVSEKDFFLSKEIKKFFPVLVSMILKCWLKVRSPKSLRVPLKR